MIDGTFVPPSPSLPSGRSQEILQSKDHERALQWCSSYNYAESWAIIDGAVVIYNLDDPPAWLVPVLERLDENGNTLPIDESPAIR